jgi:hypothetical protein
MDTEQIQDLLASRYTAKQTGSDGYSLLGDAMSSLTEIDMKSICASLGIPETTDAWTLKGALQNYYWSEIDWAFRRAGRPIS